MSKQANRGKPEHSEQHEALEAFLGDWRAEGWSYGLPDQKADSPKAKREKWTSSHTGRWHTGEFFLLQDEKARLGEEGQTVFDTLSVMGVKDETGAFFARSFENHGYQREYKVTRSDNRWSLSGDTERATIEFSNDLRRQTISWEWLREGKWQPLCDRVATKA